MFQHVTCMSDRYGRPGNRICACALASKALIQYSTAPGQGSLETRPPPSLVPRPSLRSTCILLRMTFEPR